MTDNWGKYYRIFGRDCLFCSSSETYTYTHTHTHNHTIRQRRKRKSSVRSYAVFLKDRTKQRFFLYTCVCMYAWGVSFCIRGWRNVTSPFFFFVLEISCMIVG